MIDHWQTRDRLETHRRRFEKSIPVGLFLTDIPFLHCRVFLTVAHIRASLIISSRNRISLVFLSFRDVHRREIKKKRGGKRKKKKEKRGEKKQRLSPAFLSSSTEESYAATLHVVSSRFPFPPSPSNAPVILFNDLTDRRRD